MPPPPGPPPPPPDGHALSLPPAALSLETLAVQADAVGGVPQVAS